MQMHRILKFNLERRALALVALVALVLGSSLGVLSRFCFG